MNIFPLDETIDALLDLRANGTNPEKVLHAEAMLHELLDNIRAQIVKKFRASITGDA